MRLRHLPWGFLLFALVFAAVFTVQHIERSRNPVSFESLVEGTAPTPAQYRVLVPWIAAALRPLLPHLPVVRDLGGLRFLLELLTVFWLLAGLFFLAPAVLGRGDRPHHERRRVGWLAVILVALALPHHYLLPDAAHEFPSDMPAILVFVLGLACLRGRRWGLYYPLFVLGTLNRETTCFLTVALLLTGWRTLPRKALLGHVAAQALLWVGVKAFLWHLYRDQAAASGEYADVLGIFKSSVSHNLELFGRAGWWKVLLPLYGFLWMPLLLLVRGITDRWFRAALLTVPVFHLAMFVPAEIDELRVYGEMIPLVALGVAGALCPGPGGAVPAPEADRPADGPPIPPIEPPGS